MLKMNELLKLIKKFKLNKKSLALIVLTAGAGCMLLVGELSSEASGEVVSATDTAIFSAEYTSEAEKELEKILEEIDGAGDVRVMLTLESCYENIYARAYTNEKENGESSFEENTKEEYVIVKKGSGNEECLVVKVYEPEIKGVAVVCEGGDITAVKKAVTETVCALFDISSAKVSVTKMNKR